MAGESLEQAAQAFDAVINADPNSPAGRSGGKGVDNSGTPMTLFKNVGVLDPDTDPKGGGDDLPLAGVEDPIYGEEDQDKGPKGRAGGPKRGKKPDSDGDDDEQRGDDEGGEEDDGDGDSGDE